ncbi:hypothetical protein TNCV_4445061 [Trichonephila clavipes]|nr:hypothetical protein TNCV_4445061 [Trichonephila clavipes]
MMMKTVDNVAVAITTTNSPITTTAESSTALRRLEAPSITSYIYFITANRPVSDLPNDSVIPVSVEASRSRWFIILALTIQ